MRHPFEYALLRVVPRIERGERLNAGVILYCRALDHLGAAVHLDPARLAALDPAADPIAVGCVLDAIVAQCAADTGGARHAGPAGGQRRALVKLDHGAQRGDRLAGVTLHLVLTREVAEDEGMRRRPVEQPHRHARVRRVHE